MSFRYAAPRATAKRWTSGTNESTETGTLPAVSCSIKGVQPPPLIICGNARRTRMASRGPQFDHIGTLGSQPPGMCQRVLSGQVAAAIGKGILGDVDNPDNARPARRDERGS